MIRLLDVLHGEVVCITEPKIISEFLQTKSDHYIKNPKTKRFMETFLGDGLVTAEGLDHKHQRKGLLPAFNFRVVKDLYPLFWSKASEMVALIKTDLSARPNTCVVNIDDLVGRASLDIIGLAGFGSEFSSLSNPHTHLNDAYRRAFLPN
jgi:cytochrome P450